MKKKQAFGVLHRLLTDYWGLVPYTPETVQRCNELGQAIYILAPSFLGTPPSSDSFEVCSYCHETYASILVTCTFLIRSDSFSAGVCRACCRSLLSDGVVREVNYQMVSEEGGCSHE